MTGAFWMLRLRSAEALAHALPSKGSDAFTQDALIRGFVATGDRQYIDNKPIGAIAYYAGPDALAAVLTDSVIRPILAYSIREPLPVTWMNTGTGFQTNGLAPGVPTLPDRNLLGSFHAPGGTATIESASMPAPSSAYLEFRIAGNAVQPRTTLQLRSDSGEVIDVLGQGPGTRWASVHVRAPRSPFRIVARDSDPQAWIAFSPPREMGRLSGFAAGMLDRSGIVLNIGVACFVALFLLTLKSLVISDMSARTRRVTEAATRTAEA
jgi:hypothetical protein